MENRDEQRFSCIRSQKHVAEYIRMSSEKNTVQEGYISSSTHVEEDILFESRAQPAASCEPHGQGNVSGYQVR